MSVLVYSGRGAPGCSPIYSGPPTYLVRWLDHRGNVVLTVNAKRGSSFANPIAPAYAGLTFHSWCGSASNITEDCDIVAVYVPTDGKRTLTVEASALAGLTPTLKVVKSDTSTLTVDWGDGTTSTSSASGSVTLVKAAPYVAGTYQIKPYISTGAGTFTGGLGTTGNPMLAGVAVTEYWANSGVLTVSAYAFNDAAFRAMSAMTGFVACASVGANACENNYALKTVALPICTSIGDNAFAVVYSCEAFVAPLLQFINPAGLTQAFALKTLNLPSLTIVGNNGLQSHFALESASFPLLGSIGSNGINGCYNLRYLYVPLVTSISTSGSTLAVIEEVNLPSIVTLATSALAATRSATKITLGPNCTTISSLALAGCRNLRTLRVEAIVPPALASVASLADFDPRLIIEVPSVSLVAYQAATNWSSFSARMVGV